MPSISSTNPSTHFPGAPVTDSLRMENLTGARIGTHSIDDLMQRVSQRLNMDMEKTFVELGQGGKARTPINRGNACMVATLQAVHGALQDAGIHLASHYAMPAGIEELVKRTAALTLNNLAQHKGILAHADQSDTTERKASAPKPYFDPAQIALHLQDIGPLQSRLSHNPLSPFARIEPHQRWRMCLDPKKVRFVETHVTGAKDNPLLPFMFDSEPGYLHGVLHGWETAMTYFRGDLNTNFVCQLHLACCNTNPTYEQRSFGCKFKLHEGSNMTPDGAKQLKSFIKTLREAIPEYAVVKDMAAYKAFITARVTDPDAQPDDRFTKHALLVHPHVPFSKIREQMDVFVNEYNEQVKKTPKATPRQRQAQAIELCQKLEQLHPFPDGNARAFGILLLNHLLAREQLPLTMLDDPNIIDGWSTAEVAQALEAGQAQVAKWSINDNRSKPKASSRSCLGAFNLSRLFSKTP
jgi:hypothetical protein